MKNNRYFLSILLVAVLFVTCCVAMTLRALVPAIILPPLNIPNMVLLSLIALLLEFYVAGDNPRCYLWTFFFSGAAFALLPLMAGFACRHDFWKYGLIGAATFTLVTFVFSSAAQRLRTGRRTKLAMTITAFGIYLAFQCFVGILL